MGKDGRGRRQETNRVSRREFLGLVAASAAAQAVGCRRAMQEPIVPYVRRPPDVHPDAATVYATSSVLDGYATGLLVTCRDGRPIKVEGNPEHPASLGATGPMEQAEVLQLYDPDRARELTLRGGPASWAGLERLFAELRARGGDGLRLVLPPTSSLVLADLMDRVKSVCPIARFVSYSPLGPDHSRAGSLQAFGQALDTIYGFGAADVIVALDADFLAQGPFALRYASQWAKRRDPDAGGMNRLYCAETMVSVTGSMAEHRLAVPSSEIARVALQLGAELAAVLPAGALAPSLAAVLARWRAPAASWVRAAARDLAAAAGRGAVVVGERQPAAVHALAHALNRALGNQGRTVTTVPSSLIAPAQALTLAELAAEMDAGKVQTLILLEGNAVYDAPADLDLASRLRHVPTTIYLGPYENETRDAVQWFVPAAHPFETWGDARALDGTLSLLQPLLPALHGERTAAELLAALAGTPPSRPRDLLRSSLERRFGGSDFPALWRESLRAGMVAGTAATAVEPAIDADAIAKAIAALEPGAGTEINLLPDPGLYDGRFANNAWLLELPRPISSLSWGNAAYLAPETAAAFGVKTGEVVELELDGRRARAPAFVLSGHATNAVTLHLGFGRQGAEHLARNVGSNAFVLRTWSAHFRSGLLVRRTEARKSLALLQLEHEQHGREVAVQTDLGSYRSRPDQLVHRRTSQPSLYPAQPKQGDQWAMSIDLGQCTGCGACVVACQAENNVPVVGEAEVRRGHAMHWLRIDSYVSHGAEPRVVHQPMACQHCENAPCEYVCPVNATVHSPDGLNEMVYNRCVGTRFCSNNCPYKVRRFNWFNWHKREDANQGSVRLQRNPEVTVRDRGVMEKCTYCVQRIRNGQIEARLHDRELAPGEVRTACQQACPTGAIAFGSLEHRQTPVVERRESRRAYELLHEQGTRPRTWYLARVDNPNPALVRK